jgi:hypothetical protein
MAMRLVTGSSQCRAKYANINYIFANYHAEGGTKTIAASSQQNGRWVPSAAETEPALIQHDEQVTPLRGTRTRGGNSA